MIDLLLLIVEDLGNISELKFTILSNWYLVSHLDSNLFSSVS